MKRPAGLDARLVVQRGDRFVLDVDIEVEPGRTVALLGPNGSGKSTAIEALAGLIALDEGRIALCGRVLDEPGNDVFVPPAQRGIGVLFQDLRLFPHLSAIDNVAFGLRSRGASRGEARRRASEWLEALGVGAVVERRPDRMSGGESQRVALGRALIVEPDLLLLDEPLSSLDATSRVAARRVIADHLSRFPGPRLLITHDPAEAFLLADEIHVVEAGTIQQSGSPDDIRLRPRTRYVADLAGTNFVVGDARGGEVVTEGGTLHVVDAGHDGPVLATIPPHAISIHLERPEGTPRNTWRTAIARVEDFGDRVRVETAAPLPLAADVTPPAVAALGLVAGLPVWVSIKATEIGIAPR